MLKCYNINVFKIRYNAQFTLKVNIIRSKDTEKIIVRCGSKFQIIGHIVHTLDHILWMEPLPISAIQFTHVQHVRLFIREVVGTNLQYLLRMRKLNLL